MIRQASNPIVLLLLAGCLGGAEGSAVDAADKRGYSWRNPVPRAELREMATDRPDTTESPFTVDPGHVQLEMSVVSHEVDRHNPERTDLELRGWALAPLNIRAGLTHNVELQVMVDPFLRVEAESPSLGLRERASGFGDVTLRVKRNLWGNDGGATALAIMPFVKIPTASRDLGNRRVEGGVVVPLNFPLGPLGAAAMTELDWIRNEDDDGYALSWLNTFTVGFDLTEKLGAFVELASTVGEGSHALLFDFGVTYAVHADLQLDCGINLGVTRAAPDRVLFAGLSRRF